MHFSMTTASTPCPFIGLPLDLVTHIGNYVRHSAIVVACSASGLTEVRTILRIALDRAERTRFPVSRGLTVRESEGLLRAALEQKYGSAAAADRILATRQSAGAEITNCLVNDCRWPGDFPDWINLCIPLLYYEAVPDVPVDKTDDLFGPMRGVTPLHNVALGDSENGHIVAMLIDAGADVDAKCDLGEQEGLTPLGFALAYREPMSYDVLDNCLHIANFLISAGCDVLPHYEQHVAVASPCGASKDGSRRRRGCDVDSPRRHAAAAATWTFGQHRGRDSVDRY